MAFPSILLLFPLPVFRAVGALTNVSVAWIVIIE